jgi:hypothetical protein
MAMNTATVTSSSYNVIISSRWATLSSIAHIIAVFFTAA